MTIAALEGGSASMTDRTRTLIVAARRPVSAGVVELRLRPGDSAPLDPWTPGAHVDLILPGDRVRQYSLCGSPGNSDEWRIAVLREPAGRGGSSWIHDHLREGERVRVRGPRNHFPLLPLPRYVFLAGGIGITPILPMIAAAQAAGADWHLHYGGRSRSTMAFLGSLADHGDRVTLWPQDEVGLMDLESALPASTADTPVYCCGPAGLIEAVEARCAQQDGRALHVERFTAAGAVPGQDGSFDVECRASGVTVTVPAGTSVLDALRAAGLRLLSSCGEGVCGTCETAVLDGEVDHKDSILTEEEQAAHDTMMICVSRARGERIVLDL
ncbi:ferredoxin [Amycolatopsis deserti]|uniref:Ferredoxin n=1 Tax=Amycolatopsis deserti TaxID=185696 RepID=A0ABQ3IHC9_9PSEU|nr:PDR/VanB family oxidoreductase [Amycolatopsis deserti]GHE80607.1 ferredoxin [Amycolatopsis deserti]